MLFNLNSVHWHDWIVVLLLVGGDSGVLAANVKVDIKPIFPSFSTV